MKELLEGEVERRRGNVEFAGKGRKYNKEKEESVSEQRHELAKSFGYQVDENSDV